MKKPNTGSVSIKVKVKSVSEKIRIAVKADLKS
jgi:hypothetical protein